MISKISGKLIDKSPSRIIVMTSGVGFEILISLKTYEKLPKVDSMVDIDTYLYVKEDDLKLIGFLDLREKDLFLKLLTVSGISVRIALSSLSFYSIAELCKMITESEVDFIKRIPGIGKKLAERIIIELREKLEKTDQKESTLIFADHKIDEIKDALRSLGYSNSEINNVFSKLDTDKIKNNSTEDILKIILKEVYNK
jgi:holliday junction DNA helicase RuvA